MLNIMNKKETFMLTVKTSMDRRTSCELSIYMVVEEVAEIQIDR